jgi:hypothetical protein
MRDKSFYDKLAKSISDAIADIRHRAVEEPWFGRAVTEREAGEMQPETAIGVAVCITSWPQARESHQPAAAEHNRDNAADRDLDR